VEKNWWGFPFFFFLQWGEWRTSDVEIGEGQMVRTCSRRRETRDIFQKKEGKKDLICKLTRQPMTPFGNLKAGYGRIYVLGAILCIIQRGQGQFSLSSSTSFAFFSSFQSEAFWSFLAGAGLGLDEREASGNCDRRR